MIHGVQLWSSCVEQLIAMKRSAGPWFQKLYWAFGGLRKTGSLRMESVGCLTWSEETAVPSTILELVSFTEQAVCVATPSWTATNHAFFVPCHTCPPEQPLIRPPRSCFVRRSVVHQCHATTTESPIDPQWFL